MPASIPIGHLNEADFTHQGGEVRGYEGEFLIAASRAYSGRVRLAPAEKFADGSPDFHVLKETSVGWAAIGTAHINKKPGKPQSLGMTLIAPGVVTVRIAAFIDDRASSADQRVWRVVYFDENAEAA